MSDESRSITQKHRQIQSQNLPSNSSYGGATPKWSSQKNQSIFNFEGQKRKEHHKNGKKIRYIMTITCFHHIWFDRLYIWLFWFFGSYSLFSSQKSHSCSTLWSTTLQEQNPSLPLINPHSIFSDTYFLSTSLKTICISKQTDFL